MRRLGVLAVLVVSMAIPVPASGEGAIDLQALIDTTPSGGTLSLAPGSYAAPVVIDRSMTLTGTRDVVVDAGGVGSVITIEAPDVTIDGVTIRGSGELLDREHSGITSVDAPRVTVTNNVFEDVLFGIFLRTSPDSVVADNSIGAKELDVARRGDGIRLWESEGSLVEGNTVVGGRDLVFWFTDGITVRGNTATGGRYGLHFMYSDGALVEGNLLSHNSVGAFLMYSTDLVLRGNVLTDNHGPSGYGIGLKDVDDVLVEGNRLVANRVGIYFDNSPSSLAARGVIRGNLIAYNQVGALFLPATERNTFVDNAFIDNESQVGLTGTGRFEGNQWTVAGSGNFWSDYAGYDGDGDGVGDVPYRVDDLYDTISDRYPHLRFFTNTPAAMTIDLAARMFPVLRPDPLVEDTNPLVRQPDLAPATVGPPGTGPVPMLTAGLVMLALGIGIVSYPRLHRDRRRRTAAT